MIRIDLRQHGAGVTVRAHHCDADEGARCTDACDERARTRCYADRDATPAEARALIEMAVLRALGEKGWSHRQFLQDLTDDGRLI